MNVLNALWISRRPALAFMVVGWFWGCFAAYAPVFKDRLGSDDAAFGLILLGTSIGLVTAMWLAPQMDRRLGARSVQFGALFLALAWLLPWFVTVPLLFAVTMALIGMASGLLDVTMNARVSELEATHGLSLMNGNHAMFSVAYGFSALFTGLAREAEWPAIYMLALLGCLTVLVLPLLRINVVEAEADPAGSGRYPLWPILVCGGIVLAAFMSEAAVETWSALHIERTLGGGAAEGALGPAMLGFTMAFGRFSGQAVTERISDISVAIWAALLAASGAFIAGAATTPAIAYLGFGILGLGVSVIGPIGLAVVGRLVSPQMRTEAISRAAVIGFSGFFVAPVLMGFVSDFTSLRVAFSSVAIIVLLVVPLSLVARRLPEYRRG